jgi:hypothetical protein
MRPKARTPFEMKHSAGPAVVLAWAVLVGCLFVGTNLYYNRGDVSDNGVNISAFSTGARLATGNGSGTTTVIPSVPEPAASSTFWYWEPPTSLGSQTVIC